MMIQVQIAFMGGDPRKLRQRNRKVRKEDKTIKWCIIKHVTSLGRLSNSPPEDSRSQFEAFVSDISYPR